MIFKIIICFACRFDGALCNSFLELTADPTRMTHVHEIVSLMQGLYSSVLGYGEQWASDLKEWLLKILAQKMTLPIEDPESLMVVIQCLTRWVVYLSICISIYISIYSISFLVLFVIFLHC